MLSVLEQRASGWFDQQPQQPVAAEELHIDLDTLGNLVRKRTAICIDCILTLWYLINAIIDIESCTGLTLTA